MLETAGITDVQSLALAMFAAVSETATAVETAYVFNQWVASIIETAAASDTVNGFPGSAIRLFVNDISVLTLLVEYFVTNKVMETMAFIPAADLTVLTKPTDITVV